jgi:hypothetical protein
MTGDACHTFAIAKTWQRSVRDKEAGIVDRPDTNSKIRTEESVHHIRIHALAPGNRPVQATDNPALLRRKTYPKLKQRPQRRYPKHGWR